MFSFVFERKLALTLVWILQNGGNRSGPWERDESYKVPRPGPLERDRSDLVNIGHSPSFLHLKLYSFGKVSSFGRPQIIKFSKSCKDKAKFEL